MNPSPELVQRLADRPGTWLEKIINAYCVGADHELEACCEELEHANCTDYEWLRARRRPKPATLKERGREALQNIHNAIVMETGGRELDVLKEIVESLPD